MVASKTGHRAPSFFDVAEVRGLGLSGAWVKHSPPKRLRKASAVAVSGKQNRIWNCSTSCRFRPRRTGMRRSRWNASISRKTLRKPPGGNVSSTRCGKSRSFVRPNQQLQDIFKIGRDQADGHQLIERGREEHPRALYIWFVTIAAGFGAVIGAVKAVPFVRRQLRTLAVPVQMKDQS